MKIWENVFVFVCVVLFSFESVVSFLFIIIMFDMMLFMVGNIMFLDW